MPRFNRAHRGLYGNRMIQFGNKKSFAENKTRRTWKPNVQKISFFSDSLQKKLQFRITTHALRTLRKAGGIDEYLLKTRDSEIKYYKAIEYKTQIKVIRAAAFLPRDTIVPRESADDTGVERKNVDAALPLTPTPAVAEKPVGLQQIL